MEKPAKIRVIAICTFRIANRILVFEAFDFVEDTPFYRPLGGGIEPGETSKETIIREIREELGQEIANVQLLGVLEEIFIHEGNPAHEVIFVYDGEFVDTSIYEQPTLIVREDNGEVLNAVLNAVWKELAFFNDDHLLVPKDLRSLLEPSNKSA
jgi:8-oxo-dGTP pyrophosphatase MutT (NUDIX family)